MKLLARMILGIAANGAALYGAIYFLDEVTFTGGWKFYAIAGSIIGILNTFVKPLMKVISFPFVLLSAGLFLIIINAVLLWLTKNIIEIIAISDIAFSISGWFNYLVASLIFGFTNWFLHIFIKD